MYNISLRLGHCICKLQKVTLRVKGCGMEKNKSMLDAWNLQTGKSKEDAQVEFIALVQKIINDLENSNYQEPTIITSRRSPNQKNCSQKDRNVGDKGHKEGKKRMATKAFKNNEPSDDDVENMI